MTSVKEESIQLIQSLPETITWEDIIYEMYVKMKIRKGIQDFKEGRTFSHEDVMKRFGL